MKLILAFVNPRRKGETFLESVQMEGPGAQPLLIQLLQDRRPMTVTRHKGRFALCNFELLPTIEAICESVPKGKAAVGKNGEHPFVIVPYDKDRMIQALIRSARTFRMLHQPVRLIETERDLLNSHVATHDPRFKD